MSRVTRGNIKIVTARYDNINGEICENSAHMFIIDDLKGYIYSRLKYTETEAIIYIPYIKYNNRIFLYKQKPVCKITEDNINIAIMADLICIPSNDMMQVIKNWIVTYGDKSKSKYVV